MHLLFDLDGTLTNPYRGIAACIRYALQQLSQPLPDESSFSDWIGPPLQDSFATVLDSTTQVNEAIRLYRDRFATVGLYENEVYEGIPAMLAEVARSPHTAWVCTSKPRVFAEEIVAHFQLAPFFQGVYGSELNGDRAHKGDLIAHLLTTEGIDGADAIMIGDRHHDIAGAKHNGLRAIGVTWGFGTVNELTDAGADVLCHVPNELMAQVRSLP